MTVTIDIKDSVADKILYFLKSFKDDVKIIDIKETMPTTQKLESFNEWNEVKKRTDNKSVLPNIRQREIYWANIGENIGFEQNGKGNEFMRPLLIFKKFSNNMFFGIPLSTQSKKEGSFFFEFSFKDDEVSTALIVQGRLFDAKRLDRKMGKISVDDYDKLKLKFKGLFNV